MPSDADTSPLSKLLLRRKPDVRQLFSDVKTALHAAHNENMFRDMQYCHNARFNLGESHYDTLRLPGVKELPPGVRPCDVFPFPGAFALESTLTDEIINETTDLLTVAEARASVGIMPALPDLGDDQREQLAEDWGAVREHYREETQIERGDALAQMVDHATEYGHAVAYCGWIEEKQIDERKVSASDLVQMLTAAAIQAAQQQAEGGQLDPQSQDEIIRQCQTAAQMLLSDPELKPLLAEQLRLYDKEVDRGESLRWAAGVRKTSDPVPYYVAKVVRSVPDIQALRTGLDVFFPPNTTRIRNGAIVVRAQWFTAAELRAKTKLDDEEERWDAEGVRRLIQAGPTNGNEALAVSGMPAWVLSGTTLLDGVEIDNVGNLGATALYRVLTVYYKATALAGVQALYKTIFSEQVPDVALNHQCCEHAHGRLPFVDYVRERRARYLTQSRGVGRLSRTEQEEIRAQINALANNAAMKIKPALDVPAMQEGLPEYIYPGVVIPTRRSGNQRGIEKIDLAGDFHEAAEVMKDAMIRSNRYWLRGTGPEVDPIAKQVRQSRLTLDWLATVRELEVMVFQLIQQYAPDEILVLAAQGQPLNLRMTRDDIQGRFSLTVDFDTGTLDPKTVQNRIKLLQTMVMPMDRRGQLNYDPLLRKACDMVSPGWGRLLVTPSAKAAADNTANIRMRFNSALLGTEMPFEDGRDHAANVQWIQQQLNAPATDAKGQPIPDPQSGQPAPGYAQRLMAANPDVAGTVQRLLEFEQFQAQQQQNADTGRTGVEPAQPWNQTA